MLHFQTFLLHLPQSSVYEPSLQVPLTEPYKERCSISKAFPDIISWSPHQRSHPPGSSYTAPIQRQILHYQSLLSCILQSSPQKAHMERDSPFREPSLTFSHSSRYRSPSSRFPQRSHLWRERCPFSEPYFTYLFIQRKEESCVRPTDPSLTPLFCFRAICKPDKPLDVCRRLWSSLDSKIAI